MKITALSLSLLLGLSSFVRAQSPAGGSSPKPTPEKPVLPTGPLLNPAADFSQWDVTFAYPDDQQKKERADGPAKPPFTGAEARPRKTITTKTGRIIHEEVTDLHNRLTDKWYTGTTQYTKLADGPTWYQAEAGVVGNDNFKPLPANGFRDLDWIKAENYAGTMPYGGGRQCFVFAPGGYAKLDLSVMEGRDKRLSTAETVAYIDAETRLPVVLHTHGETRSYHFAPPPAQMQTLPSDLSDQIRKGDDARKRLYQPAPRPS